MNLKHFLDIAENNVVFHKSEPIFNIIVDAGKDKYPFLIEGLNKINGEETFQTNQFYKDVEQLTKASEKMIVTQDESLEVLFTGGMNKYTLIFKKVKRSDFGTGCNVFKKNNEENEKFVFYHQKANVL